MNQFHRILVAVDLGREGGSPTSGSRRAIERAAWIARGRTASLTLVHSESPDEYWDDAAGKFDCSTAGNGGGRRQVLEGICSELAAAGVTAKPVLRSEAAWLAVIHEAIRIGADLVVAAKRTEVHRDDRKLGSVARKLLRYCPSAVWLEEPGEAPQPTTLLAATDLTPVGDRVVELAASVAHACAATLHVVHACSITMSAQLRGGERRREHEILARAAAREQIEGVLAATPLAGVAQLHIGQSSPAQAILEGVRALRPQLVVMGTVSRVGVPGVVTGNTAERLFDRLDCALLTVKPEAFVSPVTAG